jgi:predicted RNA methylase
VSATNRGAVRPEHDFFETPAWCVRAIAAEVMPRSGRVLDPCAGSGAIIRALQEADDCPTRYNAIEIDRRHEASLLSLFARTGGPSIAWGDALGPEASELVWSLPFSLVIMNPPFSLALEFVQRAIAAQRPHNGTTAVLLRLGMLETESRASFWRENAADLYALSRRPSFCLAVGCKAKCGWRANLPVDAERPKVCSACGGKVSVSTTDATAYAWFVWGPGRGGRWSVLKIPEAA